MKTFFNFLAIATILGLTAGLPMLTPWKYKIYLIVKSLLIYRQNAWWHLVSIIRDYMAVGGDKALDNVVGFSKKVWSPLAPSKLGIIQQSGAKTESIRWCGRSRRRHILCGKVLQLKTWSFSLSRLAVRNARIWFRPRHQWSGHSNGGIRLQCSNLR